MAKKILIVTLFVNSLLFVFAQTKLEYCGQHLILKKQLENKDFKDQYDKDQLELNLIEERIISSKKTRGTVYQIPVVFHVIHRDGIENISKAQILNGLEVLNRDFRKKNSDTNSVQQKFKSIISDPEIEFVLATKAPNGICFSGITRTLTTSTSTDGAELLSLIKAGNDVYKGEWNTTRKYLHIFICPALPDGTAGYTYTPYTNFNNMENGIFIKYKYIGEIESGNSFTSRALTHEVGHWLNLSHTWGSTNEPGVACGDDNVGDTPITKGWTSCNLSGSICTAGEIENVENYMEYAYCSKMFTAGQTMRMRAALNSTIGLRSSYWSSSNLSNTGANISTICSANFSTKTTFVCPNMNMVFTDESYNTPKTWNWTFPGGTPSSSTLQNPTIKYTTPGTYSVSLTVTDGNSSKSISKTNYIKVLDEANKIPYLEGFESVQTIAENPNWEILNPENNEKFEIVTGLGNSGDQCLKLANFKQTVKSKDALISKGLDLSKVISSSNVTLTFRFAYKKKVPENSEYLIISLSSDCGMTWTAKKTLVGNSLALSTDTSSKSWSPIASDWKTIHLTSITSGFWTNNTRVKFEFVGNGGNNIYLDDINLYPSGPKTEIQLDLLPAKSIAQLAVFPNPAENELHIAFENQKEQVITVSITDLIGREVQFISVNAKAGINKLLIPLDEIGKGNYLLKLKTRDGIETRKIQLK